MRDVIKAIRGTLEILGAVMFIVGTANVFGWVLNLERVGDQLGSALLSISSNPIIILLLINLMLLILGAFIETAAILIILTGLLVPLVAGLGISPVHFSVVMVMNLTIGLNTPPVGLAMFVSCGIANISIEAWLKDAWPFLLAMLAALISITFFPSISLFLPNLLLP